METDLRTFLLGDATLASAVGGTRIYPLAIPQGGTIPAIVYQRIVTDRGYAHDGQIPLAVPRVQLSVWANTPTAAWSLAELVIDRLTGYSGDMGSTEVGLVRVVNEFHDIEEADNINRFRVILDVELRVAEPVG